SAGTARGCCAVADSRALRMVSVEPAVARTRVPPHVESMPTQIERMVLLLAARDQRVVRCRRSRPDHIYVREQLLGRVMRHLGEGVSIEVARLTSRVVRPAGLGLLIPPAGRPHRVTPLEFGAVVAAVHVAVIAPPAQEEHLTTA